MLQVGEVVVLTLDAAYSMPNYKAKLHICKTNTPSPTAMRGFGKPKAALAVENMITDIADTLGILPEKVIIKTTSS